MDTRRQASTVTSMKSERIVAAFVGQKMTLHLIVNMPRTRKRVSDQ